MTFKDKLISSRAEYSVIKINFLLNVKAQGIGIHAFYENINDGSLYGSYIRRRMIESSRLCTCSKLYTYDCGNKDGVYEVHQRLNYREFINEIFIFFVDKDLDDIIPIYRESYPDVYVTTYYSIENFLVTREIVEQVWAELFKQGSNFESKDVGQKFEKCLEGFHNIAIKIMCWTIYHQRIGNNPILKNIKIKDFFKIDENFDVMQTIDDPGLISILDSQGKVKTNQGWETEINNIYQEINGIDPKTFVRGKFEMEFFVEFIKKLREILNKTPKKQKIHVDITTSNVIDILGPRVECPLCLDYYLKSNIN